MSIQMNEMETTRDFICDGCTGVLWLAAAWGRTASACGVEPLLTGCQAVIARIARIAFGVGDDAVMSFYT